MKKRMIPFFVALISISVFAGCGSAPDEEEAHEEKEPEQHSGVLKIEPDAQRKAGMRFEAVKQAEIRNLLRVTGKVVADESALVHIKPLAAGKVEKIFVQPGSEVRAGQPLVAFDYVELGELESAYRKAKGELNVAEKALERAKSLNKIGALADAEYQRREADYQSALSQLREIEIKLSRYNVSTKDIEKQTPSSKSLAVHSVLRSPISGVLLKYDAAVGELVEPQMELFTIGNLTSVWVEANVHETDLSLVEVGQEAIITSDAYAGRRFAGAITKIGDVLDVATRTIKVRCEVPNSDRKLKLEMFVDVVIPTSEKRRALLAPPESVQEIDHRPVVFVKSGENHFEKRNIEAGEQTEQGMEVVAGLKQGEIVVTKGSFSLKSEFLKAEIGSDEHGH